MVWHLEECASCHKPNWVPKMGEDEPTGPAPAFEPMCPHCKTRLTDQTPPTTKYVDECTQCHREIFIEPNQFLYPTMYLSEEQAGYTNFIDQLNYWPFGRGSWQDFESMKAHLAAKKGFEPTSRDVVVALTELTLAGCQMREKQIGQRLVYKGRAVEPLLDGSDPKHDREEVLNLMAEVKKFEKDMKDAARLHRPVGQA
jgi:hypothetical protein